MLNHNELMRFLAWLFGMPEQRAYIPVEDKAENQARGRQQHQY